MSAALPRGRVEIPRARAAIDVGSNSVHLLVALVDGHRVRPLADESTFHRLGAAAASGAFGPQLIEHVSATIAGYVRIAQGLGVAPGDIVIAGTEPFRRARDASAAVAGIARATGVRPVRLTHEEEALLTLIGVTGGQRPRSDVLVCDIGGGSTEIAITGPRRQPEAFGIRAGSATLTDRHVHHDPPTDDELDQVAVAAERMLGKAPRLSARRIVAVGGSATNLLRVIPAAGLDKVLTRDRLRDIVSILAAEPSTLAAERHGVNRIRARLLPAGAAILDAVLVRFGATNADVVSTGVREGLVLATSRSPRWRRELRALAAGWGRASQT
jgi:exopolyphosphatase/pppGpp-phosphohydrolase